jgi:bifunctional DNase/RNase
MIEVTVGGLIPDKKTGTHILLLKIPDTDVHRYLPIWIGAHEASAIAMALNDQVFERPLTHDLLKSMVDGLGAEVSRVVITAIQENTFFARIILSREQEIISIDARPSDSVALAVRAQCPIYLTEELLESQASNLYEIQEEPAENELSDASSALDELMRSVEKGEIAPGSDDDPEEKD